jgi:hypothetical protein
VKIVLGQVNAIRMQGRFLLHRKRRSAARGALPDHHPKHHPSQGLTENDSFALARNR